jgi:glycosyltransferase involved in cell wall biosynthesis
MRTLFIVYTDLGIGGIQTKIIDIVNYLRKLRPNTKIILVLREKSQFERSENITNPKTEILYYNDTYLSYLPACLPLYILYLILKYSPQSILTFTFVPTISVLINKYFFWFKKIKVVISEDWSNKDDLESEIHGYLPQIRFAIFRLLYHKADAICVVNKIIRKTLSQKYLIPYSKMVLVDNWISDLNSTKLITPKKIYNIIYVGRLDKIKNVIFIMSLLPKLIRVFPRFRFCVVGEGTEKPTLIKYAARNSLNKHVIFTGFAINPSIYLQKSQIYILASKNEGLPISALEAMHHRLPLICANFPAVKEILIHGYNGYIFSSQSTCIKFITVLTNSKLKRKTMGDNGFNYVNLRFNQKNIDKYIHLLNA